MELSNLENFEEEDFIHLQGSSYLAVKYLSIEQIIHLLKINSLFIKDYKDAFDYLFDNKNVVEDKSQLKIILCDLKNDWIFIYSEFGYQTGIDVIERLLINEKIIANYYFSDSCVDGYEWIISNGGKIQRKFKYLMGDILEDYGNKITILETDYIEYIKGNCNDFIFGGKVFYSILENTCEVKDEQYDNSFKFTIGTIKLSNYVA
jgi:hypothetical protein